MCTSFPDEFIWLQYASLKICQIRSNKLQKLSLFVYTHLHPLNANPCYPYQNIHKQAFFLLLLLTNCCLQVISLIVGTLCLNKASVALTRGTGYEKENPIISLLLPADMQFKYYKNAMMSFKLS